MESQDHKGALYETSNWKTMVRHFFCPQVHEYVSQRDLASRLNGSGVTVNSLNPGYIRTNLTRGVQATFERAFNKLFSKLAAPTWVGGERIVAAALDEKYKEVSGQYIYEDMLLTPNKLALDNKLVSQLMETSRGMTDPIAVK